MTARKDETKAQGYGKYAKGGRYGHVYTVTNKSDDANDPGSLRYAIQSPVPRTIVFALPAGKDSGTIKLATDLIITDRDCTIAGQTAFRKDSLGVCLKGFGLTVDTDDVIVRYLRSRPGALLNPGDAPVAGPRTNIDSFAIAGVSTRVIFDHCSASFSNDCLFDTVTTKVSNSEYRSRPDRAITVRNCLLAWPLDYNNHYEPENGVMTRQEHGYGGQIRAGNGAKITYCWNLYAHCRGRGPAVIGVASIATDGKGPRLDFLNNVIYGWGDKGSTSVTKASGYDDGDKYFPAGIASNSNFERNYYRARLASGAGNKHWFRTKNPNAKAWFKANAISIPPQTTWTEPGNPYTTDYVSYQTPASPPAGGGAGSLFVAAAFPTPDEFFPPLLAPALSGKRVRAGVGASITRDALDQLLLGKDGEGGQYHDGTGTIIDNENQVGGWPELSANTPPLDTDGDGIPDDREPVTPGRAVPWPHDPRNASMDDDRDGYTNLEEYLVSP